MLSHQEQLKAQFHYIYAFLSHTNASHAQGRLGGQLLQQLSSFAHAAEGAEMDCGLIDTDLVSWSPNEPERLFYDIPQQKDINALIPLDYKIVLPCLDAAYKSGQYHHQITATQQQAASAVAFIVASPLSPSYVALIPRWYLDPNSEKALVEEPQYYGPEIPLTFGAIEPFPPSWSVFVMPIVGYLKDALVSLNEFVLGRSTFYHNPYTKSTHESLPRPALYPLSGLLASEGNWNRDFNFIRNVWSAFRSHSQKYRVERIMTQPSVADLAIRHLASGEQAAIEVKIGAFRLRSSTSLEFTPFRPLPPTAVWDYLVGTAPRPRGANDDPDKPEFWLFSRDDLPQPLFQCGSRDESTASTWSEPTTGFFHQHSIKWTTDEELVNRVESILDRRRATQTYRASEKRVNPTTNRVIVGNKVSGPLGYGKQSNMTTFKDAVRTGGRIFYLPTHPAARFTYSPFCLPETTFSELSPFAITINLNIASISVNDELFATDGRRPKQFRFVTQGTSPSLFLLVPYTEKAGSTDKVYLVPSQSLDTPGWRAYMQRTERIKASHQSRNPTELSLQKGASLERYRLCRSRVADVLERLAKQDFSPDPSRLHNVSMLLAALRPFPELRRTKQDILREYSAALDRLDHLNQSDSESDDQSDDESNE